MIKRIVIEGADNVGKTTVANILKDRFNSKSNSVKIMHFTGPPNELTQKENFIESLNIINDFANAATNNLYITDRDIYGEIVYGPMYRKENPNWIWELEKCFYKLTQNSLFILLEDTAKNSLSRDDGKSFTTKRFKRYKEILKFRKAFRKSIIPNKYKIKITNKTPLDVANEITACLVISNMRKY